MAFRVRWTLPAAEDFEALAKRIEQDSDFLQSQEVAREIFHSIEALAEHPYIGEALEDYPNLRRRLSSGFRIVYEIFEKESTVEITRLLHQRQDWKSHFKKG